MTPRDIKIAFANDEAKLMLLNPTMSGYVVCVLNGENVMVASNVPSSTDTDLLCDLISDELFKLRHNHQL